MVNICSSKLAESKSFYAKLFDMKVEYDSDWFVHLISEDRQLEIGIIDPTHEIVPGDLNQNPQGFYLTFVVDSADEVFAVAESNAFEVVSAPADTFYGQRRCVLKDPNGTVIDVSSPIKGFTF